MRSPSISPDGHTLYLAADYATTPLVTQLFVTRHLDGQWTALESMAMPDEPDPRALRYGPCVSYDEQTLYFTRAIFDVARFAQVRIWQSTWGGTEWSAPVDLGDVVNYPDPWRATSDPSISADGTRLLFGSDRPGGFGGMDIWVSAKVGGDWTEPVNLGPGVNTPYHEQEPSLTSDGLGIVFASDRPGGLGNHDIWISHWLDGEWVAAKNLGPGVNSYGDDRDPEVSKDGEKLFIAAIRDGNLGVSDLWMTSTPGADPVPVPVGSISGAAWMAACLLIAGVAALVRRTCPVNRPAMGRAPFAFPNRASERDASA